MRIEPATGPSASEAAASDSPAGNGAATANGTSPAVAAPANGSATVNGAAAPPGTGTEADQATRTSGATPGTAAAGRPTRAARAPRAGGVIAAGTALAAASWRRTLAAIRHFPAMLRVHWLASVLIAGGVVLRALAQMAYHPAIIYIDTLKYLYDNWPGSDPVGYKVPLKAILLFGDLGTVEVIQHLLGIAIAITLYAVMVRRGVPRWLGAIAIAPVLLDAYQVQVESMIMPDIWFEALVVAGLAVLLWRPALTMRMALAGGALLGASVGIRQVGEVLIVPALIFVVGLGGGWRKVIQNAVAVVSAFALAVLFYLSADYQLAGHFWISRSSVSLTYGRMAAVADCKTLKLPKVERPLCPTKAQQAWGPDKLDHWQYSPLRLFDATLPYTLLADKSKLVANFNKSVERQQPMRVISGILHDAVKLFAVTRGTSPGDTPIVRWQFQRHFPTVQYGPWIEVRNNRIWLDLGSLESGTLTELNPAYGGPPQVNRPIAAFLRYYQLHGGYTPGPLFAVSLIAGLLGSVIAFMRRRRVAAARQAAIACLLFFTTGVFVLGVSDLFEFTWRYQIPALVTLPPAAAFGVGALMVAARKPREQAAADTVTGRAPEMAAPAP